MWKVAVNFPEYTSWNSIKSDYFDIKSQFTAKYSEGKSYEFFSKPYYEGDGYEMTALTSDKCTFTTFWDSLAGNISIEMTTTNKISIAYEDRINSELDSKEKTKAIQDEI